jgi:Tol biopolymer transport system component
MRALLLSCVLLVAAPAAARATLVFDREPLKPAVWIAGDDGGHARKLAAGSQPRIAPDGRTVAFLRIARSQDAGGLQLMVVPADGSARPRVLLRDWDGLLAFAWSPDARTIATAVGRDGNAPKRLVLVDVATGTARTVARGFFEGVSFAPDGTALAYSRHLRNDWPPRADLWRVPLAAGAPAGAPVRMTSGHDAVSPVWGPAGTIVFTRLVDAKRRKYGPKGELYLLNAGGAGLRRLTTTKVDPLLYGLTATQWSADGTRLLAQFSGQDTSYAERVDPATGRHRPVLRAEEGGLQATRLSRDGATILGATGGFDPDGRHDVVTVPYAGGTPTVLARNAFNPDWDR